MREDQVRAFVSWASGIPRRFVMPRREGREPPTGQVYATVLLISDLSRDTTPAITETYDGDQWQARQTVHCTADFSIQFYRAGAHETALRFRDFAMSDIGALVAEGGIYAWPVESPDPWEPFSLPHPFPQIRQLDEAIPRDWMADTGRGESLADVSDEDEQRRGIDFPIDYIRESAYSLGRIESVEVHHREWSTTISIDER